MSDTTRVALVTGAAQGIGRTYAEALAGAGLVVVCADVNVDGAGDTARRIQDAGGQAHSLEVDVSDPASTRALATQVSELTGTVHVLVNNAAIYDGIRLEPQMEVDIDYWRRVFTVNLDGALLMTQALAPLMIEQRWGRVVNQASIGAYTGAGGVYAVSKLALVGLTQGFARELGSHGITVNALAPGIIDTPATRSVVDDAVRERLIAQTPTRRLGEPDDLVGPLLFLTSQRSAWVNGQTIVVDGGVVSRI